MNYTENLSLGLPEYGESADVAALNRNSGILDAYVYNTRQIECEPYDSTKTYMSGDLAIHNEVIYECNTDNTTGAWDDSKWDSTTLAEQIAKAKQMGGESALADLDDVDITSPTDGQALLYDDSDDKWKNQNLPDVSVTKEASGNPIELMDSASAPMVKCVTQITGSQDLHGYDKPWVGGAGKNKCELSTDTEFDSQRCVITYGSDNTITILTSGNYGRAAYKITGLVPGERYAFSALCSKTLSSGIMSTIYFSSDDAVPWSKDLGELQIGTGIVSETLLQKNFIPVNNYVILGFYASAGAYYPDEINIKHAQIELGSTATSFAPYSNICPITAYTEGEIEVSDGDGNVTTHTTTYPSAIYRGSEDVVNGEVTKEWGVVVFDGSEDESWTRYGSGSAGAYAMQIDIADIKQAVITSSDKIVLTNFLETITTDSTWGNYDAFISRATANTTRIVCGIRSITTPADWKTYLSSHNLVIAYELATPTTSSVTPTNLPIRTLSGYNHIESTTGEMEVEYITEGYQPLVDLIQSSNGHTYSTSEQVVGKWIDGRPIYERIIEFPNVTINSGSSDFKYKGDLMIKSIIPNADIILPDPQHSYYVVDSIQFSFLGMRVNCNTGELVVVTVFAATNADLHICLQYTKSTTTRSLNTSLTSQKAQIEPLTDKTEETPTEDEKAVNEEENNDER